MKKIELEVYKLNDSRSQQGAFALVLKEMKGNRSLPIIIGANEAQSIAVGIHHIKPVRPLTHDLFKNFADSYKITIKEVLIYNLIDGVFYAQLICNDGKKNTEIDARTSDAVSIALRFNAPIYVYDFILEQAGIHTDQENDIFIQNTDAVEEPISNSPVRQSHSGWANVPTEELERKIEEALSNEDYELAALLRDEIQRRNK